MSETSLGKKNNYLNQQDLNPEFMESSKFQYEKQLDKQQNQQQSSFRPQVQQYNSESSWDEQRCNNRTTPFVFTAQNMPKIICFNHQGQTLTNFCKCKECLLPLCPECVKEHVYEHSEFKSYPRLECLENILTAVHQDVCQQGIFDRKYQANQLADAKSDIQKSISQAYSSTQETVYNLKEVKKRIINIVEQYFNALEIELENKQRKNYDNFNRDGKAFISTLQARLDSHHNFLDKLKQPDCMYSLLPYLLSTTQQDNNLYLQAAQQFQTRFKDTSSLISFNSFKSSQLSSQIAEIVNVVHQDLPEFLEIHKLASPDIIQSKVLTVKSQNSQVPQTNLYQSSKVQGNIEVKDQYQSSIIQQHPGLEQSYGYPQVPQQQIQNPLLYSGYPQQIYGQQQPFKQTQLVQPNKYQGYPQTLQIQSAYPNFNNTQLMNQGYTSQRFY
ncbi:unnamed protein product (macronuclear) [Paramecium tetraurelia]|uniref:Chromosome undetermined scaffold_1, whole genome shotgun sequence n=1 Tax=Paramecium tetraurelia TaxID=5888 RepID=Q6BG01_PARTE|nr:hypothetical protein [Paramecium tetraurelia strain d4-2]XP_001423261.1 uncharacterized protein GSPATT00000298001 [Paramecium tetraurelia]CAH03419.1 hypothetical protein PTMB.221 [Paramecium tetraurelia]CAK55863.1 unnamed protein product [Paramecium tetraurelia]|eukprot:XP_001423261.1 hypothetical protein (macronuclear) [Paramecium tetraurelia strain d4-2]